VIYAVWFLTPEDTSKFFLLMHAVSRAPSIGDGLKPRDGNAMADLLSNLKRRSNITPGNDCKVADS
jgi:hypothetical protein